MDAKAFKIKFQNSEKTDVFLKKLVDWCKENIGILDFSNKDFIYLYENAMKYLFNVRIGRWNEEDAKLVLQYISRKFANRFFIDANINITILDHDTYESTYGNTIAVCVDKGNCMFDVVYSPKVIENLMSNAYLPFRRGLQFIYHEIVHVLQNCILQQETIEGCSIPYTKKMYIMALETITRKIDPQFYKANYIHLLKENHAEKIGLQEAMNTIGKYNMKLYAQYNQEDFSHLMEQYDKNFFESKTTMLNQTGDTIKQIDLGCCLFLEKYPEYIEKMPILKLAFHTDGTKKNVIELLKDRELLLATGRKKDVIDELYATIANQKNFSAGGLPGTKVELYQLDEYIKTTATDDEFVFDLIKYRLINRTNMTEKQINEYIKMEREYSIKQKESQNKKQS